MLFYKNNLLLLKPNDNIQQYLLREQLYSHKPINMNTPCGSFTPKMTRHTIAAKGNNVLQKKDTGKITRQTPKVQENNILQVKHLPLSFTMCHG